MYIFFSPQFSLIDSKMNPIAQDHSFLSFGLLGKTYWRPVAVDFNPGSSLLGTSILGVLGWVILRLYLSVPVESCVCGTLSPEVTFYDM